MFDEKHHRCTKTCFIFPIYDHDYKNSISEKMKKIDLPANSALIGGWHSYMCGLAMSFWGHNFGDFCRLPERIVCMYVTYIHYLVQPYTVQGTT